MTEDETPDLAADYVLGLASAEERARAEDRIARDPVFAQEVESWQARLSQLNTEFDAVTPPAAVLDRAERSLFGTPQRRRIGVLGWLRRAGAGRGTTETTVRGVPRPRFAILLGLAAVTTVALMAFWDMPLYRSGPPLADLSAPDLQITIHGDTQRLIFRRVSAAPDPEGQSYELWLIRDGQVASLGLLAPETTEVRAEVRAGDVLAVSLEPSGGSPLAGPSGPVLATAQIPSL
ncbi:anti-sigma factor domain-containing protein [Pseudooceanicola nanhaiensis]|uniref:anti-sigma factor n=1 Tax=Pseudooceanicola nanhaiensis TaxID=375761 RepID=UPI001CD7E32F|nr:anti-sigma factor [Pseudooceanicola nanhaiensis]MCA0922188.1 anti-sigma factor [Pseudooceanicola nanhaiensis]